MNGSALAPEIRNLKWPPRGSNVESGEKTVQQRLSSLPGMLLVFGAASNIPGLQGREVGQIQNLDGRRILIQDSVVHLMEGADGKRELWKTLQNLVSER